MPSTSGEQVTLSAFRGRSPVLLCFFPAAFSSTCTSEFCDMRDSWDAYRAHGVEVFPVSVDSKYALAEYKAKYGFQVDLLSDMSREVSQAYGTYMPHRWWSNRAYFLVDRDGIVRWAHVEEHPGQRRSNEEVLAELAKLD
ncbi:MAG: redoxin domain-containing protein [Gemmatimonadaceae bacterium]|nr:redoxin domain-containing protein [Gemmatimonadaceae bacterium]